MVGLPSPEPEFEPDTATESILYYIKVFKRFHGVER